MTRKKSETVPDGKELLQDEKRKTTATVESAADLLRSDFDITDSPSAEDDVDSCQELEDKLSASVQSLKEKRKSILERLQELSCAENSSSEYEENEVEDLKRCSNVAFTKENLSRVSRDERRSSTSSATGSGSGQSKRSKTCRSKKSYEQSKWRGSRTDDSDLSLRERDLRDTECGTMQEKNVRGKKSSTQTKAKLKGMSSRHCEPMRDTERDEDVEGVNQCKLAQSNRPDCDESQKTWQSWLVRHVNQLFIRGDNVVLISVNET